MADRAGFKITELFAFIATDEDGTEGVCSMHSPAFGNLPMVGADPARIESLRPHAEKTAEITRVPIVLARFRSREDEEIIRG